MVRFGLKGTDGMNSGYLDKITHADCREHLGRLSGLTDLLDNYWSGSHAGGR